MATIWIKETGCGHGCECEFKHIMLKYKGRDIALFQANTNIEGHQQAFLNELNGFLNSPYQSIGELETSHQIDWHISDERAAQILKELRVFSEVPV